MPRRRPRRRKTDTALSPPPSDAEATSRQQLELLLDKDPRFQATSVDGLAWIDPWTGTVVPAPFETRRTALDWLLQHRPWERRGQLLSLPQLEQLKWHHFLRQGIREEQRLRGFDRQGHWLNPYNGEWEEGVPFDGSVTRETLAVLTDRLARCPAAANGRLMSRDAFERLLAQGYQRPQTRPAETQPLDQAASHELDHLPSPSGANPLLPDPDARTPAQEEATELIAGYRILSRLGEGGMGVIYLARQMSMERDVALKVLRGDHLGESRFQRRFLREARTAGSISHPNTVTIYDVGKHGSLLYMSMEYMEGGDALREAQQAGGALSERRGLTIMRETAEGLAALHAAGLVHRDIKPTNIFLTRDGHAKLGDMGLVQDSRQDEPGQEAAAVGTPCYMAPEQAGGHADIDPRTDIYGLGATIFTLLSGRPPFDGESPYAIIRKVIAEPAPDLRECCLHVSDLTATMVARCLSKHPQDRYADVASLLVDIGLALETASDRPAIADPDTAANVPTISVEVDLAEQDPQTAVDIGIHHACVDHCSFLHQCTSRAQTSWWCGHLDDPDPDSRLQFLRAVPQVIDAAASVDDALLVLEQSLPPDIYLHLQVVQQLETAQRFRVWTCGVDPIWLYQADHNYALRRLGHDQDALGSGDREWQASDIVLRPGAVMLLYTPAVTDCEDPAGLAFGQRNLAARLIQVPGDAVAIAREIGRRLDEHCQGRLREDVALITLRQPPADEPGA